MSSCFFARVLLVYYLYAPNIDSILDEKVWRYYIFLFDGIEPVGAVEHDESVTRGKERDHV